MPSAPADASIDTGSAQHSSLVFYPAYCFRASPTWFTWVKLTAYDIHHHLRTRPGFQATSTSVAAGNGWAQTPPLLLFYLNHPIQFVQLIGVVVAFEDFFDRFWLFTVDDSSGATIEVNCRKLDKDNGDGQEVNGEGRKKDDEAEARHNTMSKIGIGTVVQVKGQISTYRETRQLQLERIVLIHETNQEMRLVAARTDFRRSVLSQPWELLPAKQKMLRQQALGEGTGPYERTRRRLKGLRMEAEREKRHAERIAKKYKQEEEQRKSFAEEARKAGQRLKVKP